jgi:SNF2 family DNA or RNA helicase
VYKRQIQAGHFSGVFHALESDGVDTIIDAYKMRKQKRLNELRMARDIDEKTLEKIDTIESHLHTLDDKIFKYVIGKNCVLCNQPHTKPSVLSCCQNIFCGMCVTETSCPMCKTPVDEIKKIPLKIEQLQNNNGNDNIISCAGSVRNNTKIDTILSIVGDAVHKKILIFSNYNESFTLIKKFLDEKKISYLELRGTKERRDNTIDSYKTGSVNVLLLNTIYSGAGLNLQETSDIILYHQIHEYQKIQVIGRANRIGRTIPLIVHYLE